MFGTARDVDTACAQFNEEKYVDRFQPQGFDRKKVTGQHLVLVMAQERAPGAFGSPLRCWEQVMAFEEIANGRAVDGIAELRSSPAIRS